MSARLDTYLQNWSKREGNAINLQQYQPTPFSQCSLHASKKRNLKQYIYYSTFILESLQHLVMLMWILNRFQRHAEKKISQKKTNRFLSRKQKLYLASIWSRVSETYGYKYYLWKNVFYCVRINSSNEEAFTIASVSDIRATSWN